MISAASVDPQRRQLTSGEPWYSIRNADAVESPALLLYPERVQFNLRQMLSYVSSPSLLRPHIKTHKLPEILRMQLDAGITKCKCATMAEAEMAATTGVEDVLLAYPPVGPNIRRFLRLVQEFPRTRFSTIGDHQTALRQLAAAAAEAGLSVEVLLDLDVGQHRSGISPGEGARAIYRWMHETPGIEPGGLHAYDGHVRDRDPKRRKLACDDGFRFVESLRRQLLSENLPVPRVVAGGSPTFPFHAAREGVECSPGTVLLWDAGNANAFRDLGFIPAALVFSRVISKPDAETICLDLGHKAVASENPSPRVEWFGLGNAETLVHSEEHLVVRSPAAAGFEPGDCLYGLPFHICPTVALHSEAVVIKEHMAVTRWKVVGRERRLTI